MERKNPNKEIVEPKNLKTAPKKDISGLIDMINNIDTPINDIDVNEIETMVNMNDTISDTSLSNGDIPTTFTTIPDDLVHMNAIDPINNISELHDELFKHSTKIKNKLSYNIVPVNENDTNVNQQKTNISYPCIDNIQTINSNIIEFSLYFDKNIKFNIIKIDGLYIIRTMQEMYDNIYDHKYNEDEIKIKVLNFLTNDALKIFKNTIGNGVLLINVDLYFTELLEYFFSNSDVASSEYSKGLNKNITFFIK